jgi:transcriptional regulator with GAF, ATPase, and Fis domain
VQRVGGDRWSKVDVRVLAATRRDLDAEVDAGRFREDLYYRLAVARIELPPLRRRDGDVGVLARYFWRKLEGPQPMPDDLIPRFEAYSWPGNVRELRNAVVRRIALGDMAPPPGRPASSGGSARPAAARPSDAAADVTERILEQNLPLPIARQRIVEQFERRYVERVLAQHGGNVTRAAHASGIARRYFYEIKHRVAAEPPP